jgi:hypothetical protein
MDDHYQAVHDNNYGVRLMLEGRDKEAAKMFSSSLRMIKDHLVSNPTVRSSLERRRHHIFHSEVEVPGPFCRSLGITTPDVDDAYDITYAGFIFKNAIVLKIAPSEESCSTVDEEVLNTHSSCSIFNVALLHHRVGMMATGYRRACGLRKAQEMYAMCIKILQSSSGQHLNSCMNTISTVLAASTNNLAQIQLILGSYSNARQNLHALSRILYRVQIQSARSEVPVFSSDVWDGLLSNTMMLKSPNVAPAA